MGAGNNQIREKARERFLIDSGGVGDEADFKKNKRGLEKGSK